jgi:hypothetical protein
VEALAAGMTAAASPTELANLVLERFANGTPQSFNEVYPHEEGRRLLASAVADNRRRVPGDAKVLSEGGGRAVLLLTGHFDYGNPGGETILSRGFSGLYEAQRTPQGWRLTRHLPIDADSSIRRQDVTVDIRPGSGIDVKTRLNVRVDRAEGIAVRLNRSAALAAVRLDGRQARHSFSGGLLWVQSPAGRNRVLELTYSVPPGPASSNTLAIGTDHGFIRDQEIWLPILNYRTEADMADFLVVARIPARYQLSTSIPQQDTVRGGIRQVTGKSTIPTFGLSLGYDVAWTPSEITFGDTRLSIFAGPEFRPDHAQIKAAFRWTHDHLTRQFGPPQFNYFAISERRSAKMDHWNILTNNTIVAGTGGGALRPRSGIHAGFALGHEMAHAWTRGTGGGRFLLMEGWATFAESYLVGVVQGPDAEKAFWDTYRNRYELSGSEGAVGILTDYNNRGVAYTKGPWIFRMLRDRLGEAVFLRGLRSFMDLKSGPCRRSGVHNGDVPLSRYDVWPILRPWIEEEVTPDLTARSEGGRLRIAQTGPVFDLPLTVELVTASGVFRRRYQINARESAFNIADVGPVTSVRLDPERKLLLRRPMGEMVTFDVEAPSAAQKVQIAGDFTSKPIDALLQNGSWRVTVPISEGFYHWHWLVDGKRPASFPSFAPVSGTREVRPLEDVSEAGLRRKES